MANNAKKFWKLQSFVAHDANVNCLSLGHKSGRVLATGGDDKNVNLWAVGKDTCIISLSGHATPIETVRFNHTEELIAAGSTIGVLKIWDLEAAKIVKTLTGHRMGITCIDFHPYGDFLCSGSYDSMIKLWDIRKKGCIATLKAHKNKVNSLRFSPDGQWIASCGEDAIVKLWDVRAGKVIHEFTGHTNAVSAVEFHPHEFLLVSGGIDRSVHFFDLESFMPVSTEKEVGNVKCLFFNRDGTCVFTGMTEGLKILGWEPNRLFDSVAVNWGKVSDIAVAHNQLVGASFHLMHVTIHIVDLKKLKPFSAVSSSANDSKVFSYGQSVRKSFNKFTNSQLISTNTNDDIVPIDDYTHVFQPSRSLTRTPPPPAAPFEDPERDTDVTSPQIISDISPTNENDEENDSEVGSEMSSYADVRSEPRSYEMPPEIPVSDVEHYTHQQSSPPHDTTFTMEKLNVDEDDTESTTSTTTRSGSDEHSLRRQPVMDAGDRFETSNRRIADFNGNTNYTSRSENFIHSYENGPPPPSLSVSNYFQRWGNYFRKIYSNQYKSHQQPASRSQLPSVQMPPALSVFAATVAEPEAVDPIASLDEDTAINYIHEGHNSTLSLLMQRVRVLRNAGRQLSMSAGQSTSATGNTSTRQELGRILDKADAVLINDLLRALMYRSTFWSLDMFVVILPSLKKLLQSRIQTHISTALECLSTALNHFSHLLRTMSPSLADSRDISRTERIQKCEYCKDQLRHVRDALINLRNKLNTSTPSASALGQYPMSYLIERTGVGSNAQDQRVAREELRQSLDRVYDLVRDVVGDNDEVR